MASFNYFLHQPYKKDTSGKTAKRNNGDKIPNPEETRVYLFIIHDKDHIIKLKTEVLVLGRHWNFNEKRIKQQAPGAMVINKRLDDLRENVMGEFNNIRSDFPEMKWPEITRNLKAFIINNISPVYGDMQKGFFTVFDDFINIKSSEVSELTVKKFKTLKNDLLSYDCDLTFEMIDHKFHSAYVKHLRSKAPQGRQKTRKEGEQIGLLNDTVSKYLASLKLFLKWSYETKYHKNDSFKKAWFKVNLKSGKQKKEGKNDIITLHLNEVNQLYSYDFTESPRLERVRDLFCFMCFTLQRWSDAIRFDQEHLVQIQHEGDIVTAWKFHSFKTGKLTEIPFAGEYVGRALDIAKKCDYKLPTISEQKFNAYIKEACKIAGLDRMREFKRYVGQKEILAVKPLHEYISSHTGRRTGITILLNVYRTPIHFVRDLSGHSDLNTLDKYLDKDTSSLIGSLKLNIEPLKVVRDKVS